MKTNLNKAKASIGIPLFKKSIQTLIPPKKGEFVMKALILLCVLLLLSGVAFAQKDAIQVQNNVCDKFYYNHLAKPDVIEEVTYPEFDDYYDLMLYYNMNFLFFMFNTPNMNYLMDDDCIVANKLDFEGNIS